MNINKRARYKRNLKRIEIITTYKCNRRCYNCEAMVRQAPSNESMTLMQIEKFIAESITNNIKWEAIRVLGGEPTLHKNIYDIFTLLCNYKHNYSPDTKITLVTNGYGQVVVNGIKLLSKKFDIEVENSNKITDRQIDFSPINKAPIDIEDLQFQDLSKGCYITSVCGIALDMHGYYPCSASAAIDRVFGFDIGRKQLPNKDDLMDDLLKQFCRICGHYYHELNNLASFDIKCEDDYYKLEDIIRRNQEQIGKKINTVGSVVSPIWADALEKWHKNKPELSKY